VSPAGRPKKDLLTAKTKLRYKDTRVVFIRQLTPAKVMVKPLHNETPTYWIVDSQQLEKQN